MVLNQIYFVFCLNVSKKILQANFLKTTKGTGLFNVALTGVLVDTSLVLLQSN